MLCKLRRVTAVLVLATIAGAASASAECFKKAGEGTDSTKDGAMFQAYEVILQSTDFFGTWAPWISSGGKIGQAPGYIVKNKRSSCKKGGMGFVCRYQATLCTS
ncbi:MAG: hypothetical protein ACR2PG_13035 [Hyphomicrobiaceae bacterium]